MKSQQNRFEFVTRPVDTQLVAKAPTLADGKAFARSAVNKVMSSGLEGQGTQEDRVELENRITILRSGR